MFFFQLLPYPHGLIDFLYKCASVDGGSAACQYGQMANGERLFKGNAFLSSRNYQQGQQSMTIRSIATRKGTRVVSLPEIVTDPGHTGVTSDWGGCISRLGLFCKNL